MASPDITIAPKSCLQDEKVTIKIFRLNPNSYYTITSHLKDSRRKKFFSYAYYCADNNGTIDVSSDKSFGGHYEGVFQMGLIAALEAEPSEYKYLRLFKRDVENPNEIEFRVYSKFLSPEEIFNAADSYLVNGFHYRHFIGPGVKRYPIRQGRVRATLFVPPGEGPFPGVVDMFGTAGGLLEYRSAQLASRGIVSLALAFFNYEDLPKYMFQYDLKYFREAVQILLGHDKVMKPYVGVIGVSKGADLALSMGTFIPEVTVVVSLSGSCTNMVVPLKVRDDYIIPALSADLERGKIVADSMFINRDTYEDPEDHPDTIIPIHESDAKYLLIVGEDDLSVPSTKFASISAKLMRNANKEHNIKICLYKGAGHLIEPPYSPLCSISYHSAYNCIMMWGGELKGHTEAQEKSWIELIYFIKNNLKMVTSKL